MSDCRTPPGQTFLCGIDDRLAWLPWLLGESLEKASWWLSFRSFARGLLSFCLWWGHSGVTSNTVASSSPDLGDAASQSDEQHHCLAPVGGVGVSDMVRGGVVGLSFPIIVASWGWSQKGWLRACSQLASARDTWVPCGLQGDRLVSPLCKPPEKIGNQALLSLWPHLLSLAYFHQGIVARYGCDPHRQSLPPWWWLWT